MTAQALAQRFLALFEQDRGLLAIRELLSEFAGSGGTQDQAEAVLKQLLAEADGEALDDAIRDAMDLATGWCAPHLRVWQAR